jgi:hypothetical protein
MPACRWSAQALETSGFPESTEARTRARSRAGPSTYPAGGDTAAKLA